MLFGRLFAGTGVPAPARRVEFPGGETLAIELAGIVAASWMAASGVREDVRAGSSDSGSDDAAELEGGNGRRPRISSLKSGEPRAWRWFVDEFGQALVNYAARMGHSDPEEVMGATMETVARGITGFEGTHKQFRSYVFSVAHARIVDDLRKSARRTNIGQDYLESRQHHDDHDLDDSPFGVAVADAFDGELVTAALARLSDDQRTMIYLRYVEGMSTKDTARAVGKSEVATRVALSRGLGQLREILSTGTSASGSDQSSMVTR